jgi:nucleotide-binding universal stress UspA family protein
MFKHLLVPIDLSDRNARTLRTALELARLCRARVTLLHVVHRIEDVPFDELQGFYQRLVRISERKLGRAAKPFAGKGVPVSAEVCIGEPAGEIVRAAARYKVDLIVMGSHRVKPPRPVTGWGTTSYKVGILCQCPILLVK